MSIASRGSVYAGLLGLVLALFLGASTAFAAEPPYESDPTLSLIGNCTTIAADPVPDPSCSGEPLAYPAPPNGPTGQFTEPRAIAIDLSGDQYVASFAGGDDAKGRVDVFDSEGKFITEFAARDIQTAAVDSKGNFYAFRNNGEVVRYSPTEYKPDEGKIKYGNAPVTISTGIFVGSVAVDTDPAHLDQVLIARPQQITRYKSAADAEPNGEIETFKPAGLGDWPEFMAIDSQRRRIYVPTCKDETLECGVMVVGADAPHTILEEIDGSTTPAGEFGSTQGSLPIAVDEETGDFFIADISVKKIYRFSESYEFLSEQSFSEMQPGSQLEISNGTRPPAAVCDYPTNPPPAAGDACNRHYLYVTVFKTKGRLAAFRPPGQTVPVIEAVSSPSIGETEAELRAKIFPGGLETTYHFEITTQAAYEASEWVGATSLGAGTIAAESLAKEVSTFATGLAPGQTYRFRVVADNELGPAEEEGQNEAVFTTYNDANISSGCPNETFRIGPSALLPDCRAYELVSPADTNGRPPKGTGFLGSIFPTLQASPAGDAVSFKIEGGSLPGSSGVGSFEGDPYVSKRTASGWVTDLAGPNGAEATVSAPGSFSPDQGYQFWRAREEGPLVVGENIYTEYLYYPDGHSELIGRGSEGSEPVSRGKLITENAGHVIFQTYNLGANDALKLEPDAPPTGTEAVYDRTIDPVTGAEQTHTVSLLPGDITPAAGENAFYRGASADGIGIAFSISTDPSGVGVLYLRVKNETTYEIGDEVEFAGVSEGGARIFYVEGGNLEAFDVASEEVIDFATTGDAIPVNVSSDGSRAYFVSEVALGGPNPQGDSAQAGDQNLYLSEEGTITFVAAVTERDVEGEVPPLESTPIDGLGLWTEVVSTQPAKDPSRTNPDGSVLLFQSRAEITGYEESEFPQIYRYDSDAGTLQCVSCIPTGAPATGGAALESYTLDSFSPRPFSPAAFVPNLNPQGTRVFFDSTEALVSTDTDKVTDVYEWEANGVGSCKQPQGCLYLISSGQSARDNYLYGHSISGDDVFFTTGDALTGFDSNQGVASIYDARVGGGFPEPENEEVCTADGCRPQVTPAPVLPVPAVPARGADDQVKNKAKTCPKGKRKVKKNGRVRCVKKKQKKQGGKAKRAGANRGAGK